MNEQRGSNQNNFTHLELHNDEPEEIIDFYSMTSSQERFSDEDDHQFELRSSSSYEKPQSSLLYPVLEESPNKEIPFCSTKEDNQEDYEKNRNNLRKENYYSFDGGPVELEISISKDSESQLNNESSIDYNTKVSSQESNFLSQKASRLESSMNYNPENRARQTNLIKNNRLQIPSEENLGKVINVRSKSKSLPSMKDKTRTRKKSRQEETMAVFKISSPDEVFEELEKEKNKEKEKNNKAATKVVVNNLNNAKMMIGQYNQTKVQTESQAKPQNQFSLQIIPSPSLSASEANSNKIKNELANTFTFNNGLLERVVSTCLIQNEQSHNNGEHYTKYKYELNENEIIINNKLVIPYDSVSKIKLIYSAYNRPELKITYSKELIGRNSGDTLDSEPKIKSFSFSMELGQGTNIFLCESYENIYTIFANLIVRKLLKSKTVPFLSKENLGINTYLLPENTFDHPIKGSVLKKSKHLKNWEKRYVEIQNFCLKSYRFDETEIKDGKKDEKNECTYEVSGVKELWTRFEVMEEKYIVMKMHKKNKMEKIEIAIPISNFAKVDSPNWLLALVGILKGEH